MTKIAKKEELIEASLDHHSEWKFEGVSDLSEEDKEWLESDFGLDEHVSKWCKKLRRFKDHLDI